jgi:hypothetical protein
VNIFLGIDPLALDIVEVSETPAYESIFPVYDDQDPKVESIQCRQRLLKLELQEQGLIQEEH